MKLDRSYADVLEALSPRDVAAWLRARGFTHARPFGEFGDTFERKVEDNIQEIILPTSSKARDFRRRMEELVGDLAEYEARSQPDVLNDLTTAPFDVIRIRSTASDDYGSLRLSAGIDLHEEAGNLILAAANAAASPTPRKSWRGRRFDEVGSYIDNVRLGQSQRGSFILTLLSPWDYVPGNQPSLDLSDATFGRRVTRALATALHATEKGIRRSIAEGTRPLVDAYRSGVSSNLCLALSRLAREGDGIDISIGWSPTQPCEDAPRISLKREDASLLAEAAKELAGQEAEPDFTVEGLVTLISEPTHSFNGSAVLEAVLVGTVRKVRMSFSAADRPLIFEAAEKKKWLRVTGDLNREGRKLTLVHPRDFSIIEPEDVAPDAPDPFS